MSNNAELVSWQTMLTSPRQRRRRGGLSSLPQGLFGHRQPPPAQLLENNQIAIVAFDPPDQDMRPRAPTPALPPQPPAAPDPALLQVPAHRETAIEQRPLEWWFMPSPSFQEGAQPPHPPDEPSSEFLRGDNFDQSDRGVEYWTRRADPERYPLIMPGQHLRLRKPDQRSEPYRIVARMGRVGPGMAFWAEPRLEPSLPFAAVLYLPANVQFTHDLEKALDALVINTLDLAPPS
ncbi:hypothetical protein BDY19DRAFT_905837 [Irpex rosettiformis]|uniref:Uncharacterized protein n=1 Tax=Irpex rosettiformis TaxID=378272 RepID=A0ACB8U5N2_9APHY|nr:hypothetical protein BDY19DRAFT_905837 [Irpex rosettiformis]